MAFTPIFDFAKKKKTLPKIPQKHQILVLLRLLQFFQCIHFFSSHTNPNSNCESSAPRGPLDIPSILIFRRRKRGVSNITEFIVVSKIINPQGENSKALLRVQLIFHFVYELVRHDPVSCTDPVYVALKKMRAIY